jgi:hypothetical protein
MRGLSPRFCNRLDYRLPAMSLSGLDAFMKSLDTMPPTSGKTRRTPMKAVDHPNGVHVRCVLR